MKNNVSAEKRDAAIKVLAIIGFIVAVVVFLWLAVQVVRLVPSAFQSLASLAESVYGTNEQSLTIATQKSIVNSGEVLEIGWTELRGDGTYVFSYRCTDGVSAEARTAGGDIVRVDCEENLILSGSTQNVDVIFTSERKRFTDVPFSIGFIPENTEVASDERTTLVTVVNASIAQSISIGIDDNETTGPDTTTDDDTPATPTTGGAGPTPGTPVVVGTTSFFPVSNPNGYTDLEITYLGIGAFNRNTETFTPRSTIDNDMRSAVRFSVKNIGTKTSGDWTFEADLMGFDFESDEQDALRPQERAVITLGFDEITNETGVEQISIDVDTDNDINTRNNSFTTSVRVVD